MLTDVEFIDFRDLKIIWIRGDEYDRLSLWICVCVCRLYKCIKYFLIIIIHTSYVNSNKNGKARLITCVWVLFLLWNYTLCFLLLFAFLFWYELIARLGVRQQSPCWLRGAHGDVSWKEEFVSGKQNYHVTPNFFLFCTKQIKLYSFCVVYSSHKSVPLTQDVWIFFSRLCSYNVLLRLVTHEIVLS